MKFDDVLSLLGEFGPYQKRVYFLLCVPAISISIHTLLSVFTMAMPDHRCALPNAQNDTWYPEDLNQHNLTIPWDGNQFSKCLLYKNYHSVNSKYLTQGQEDGVFYSIDTSTWSSIQDQGENASLETTNCNRYVYDKSTYQSTIVTQMDLVCDKNLLRSHAQMIIMLGSLMGTLAVGAPSDIFGRKKLLIVALAFHAFASIAITWATHFSLLCILLFINGLAMIVAFVNSFVIGMEFVGPSKRVWAGIVIEIFWSIGMIILTPIAYLLRDWQYLQLATSLPLLIYLSYWWLIPESPRWLLSKKRFSEAQVILTRAAKVNKVELPPSILDRVEEAASGKQESFSVAAKNPVIFLRCLVIFYAWFVSSLAFYGLGLNVGSLGGSVYVNFLLSGVVELASYILCICLLDRVGRRALNCSLMLIAGIACIATILPVLYAPQSHQWLTVALAMIGKLGISGAFATIWVYTSELYPTVIRNSGMAASSFCARLGGVICPYIANLGQSIGGEIGVAIPLLIFGVSSLISGGLLLMLPETLNRTLPETIEDVIHFGSKLRSAEEKKEHNHIYKEAPQDDREV